MSSQSHPIPHPRRRYLRFSVRGLIVLALVIAAGLGWVVRQAHIQRDAVAAIKKAGGWVQYDWEWTGGIVNPAGGLWAPRKQDRESNRARQRALSGPPEGSHGIMDLAQSGDRDSSVHPDVGRELPARS
jgi:hypothetical protein